MPKIVFIGAGSTVFAKNLMGDILHFPELAESTLTLLDLDADRLHVRDRGAQGRRGTRRAPIIEVTTDQRAALDGADYAICMIQVAGYRPGTL